MNKTGNLLSADTIPMDERSIRDQEVFAAFDLQRPELEPVRTALEKKEFHAAKKALVHYFETRTAPHFFYDYRGLPLKQIDTDSNPHDFQSSLGLNGSLKDFCLYAGRRLMEYVYVRPGRDRIEIELGKNYENIPHFDYHKDMGKKHRTILDIFVRGQMFEYLAVLYHESGNRDVLVRFEEILLMFFEHYPLVLEYTKPDASRFSFREERDVMSVGWLVMQYIGLLYTRLPYEINPELAFELIKRIWFLGIQFRRFDSDSYRSYNHHLWERGLVPYMLSVLLPEIPDFAPMKQRGASIVCQHMKDDFNEEGGYSEHSIPYWSGASLCSMLYRGIYLSRLNKEPLLDEESKKRLYLTFQALALISPPQKLYSSVGDNGGPMVDPVLRIGERAADSVYCREILAIRENRISAPTISVPLDYANHHCGFACSRSSFHTNANFMLMSAKVNCGDSGHNHMDLLSLFISFGGEEFFGEPHARQLYHRIRMGTDLRGYMYNMESHNTVLVYGRPVQPNLMYANKWGVYRPDTPISSFETLPEGCRITAFHDAYTTCRHSRTVLFHRNCGILIRDVIQHGNRLPDAHIQRWHLLPDVFYTQVDERAVILEKKGIRILCLWSGKPLLHIWQKEAMCPEIVEKKEDLSTVIDAAFTAEKQWNGDVASVIQDVLLLDITNREPDPLTYDRISAISEEILEEINLKAALEQFSGIQEEITVCI